MLFRKQRIIKNKFPNEIISGREVDFNKHCKPVFRSYIEARKYETLLKKRIPKPMILHWDRQEIYNNFET